MKRTRIKICGITRPEDAEVAIAAGADAIGLVFWEPSSRYVSVEQAVEICAVVPAFVSVVALTVNAEQSLIERLLAELPIDLLQFHGDETPEQCQQYGRPYMKAIRVRPELSLDVEIERFASARSVLLDTYRKGVPGGTGESFNWELIPKQYRSRIILAGGLSPDNIEHAVTEARPFAVDVSGGVEASPGIKDNEKINRFIRGVTHADRAFDIQQ